MRSLSWFSLILILCPFFIIKPIEQDTKFVFVVTSYNNAQYYVKNILAMLTQIYSSFRIIYVDDCSADGTGDLVEACVREHNKKNIPVTIIRQKERKGKMYNFYHAMQLVADEEVALDMDGDDWLAHKLVLKKLNDVYQNKNVWATYGNYIGVRELGNTKGYCYQFEPWVIASNAYRYVPQRSSHLKTFYGWLFKKIDVNDFMHNGKFLPSTADYAIMFPILELTGGRFAFISDILYLYNNGHPLSDSVVNKKIQTQCFELIKKKKRYTAVSSDEIPFFLR